MRSLGLARKGAPWRAVGNRTDHDQADGRMRGAQVTARVALGGSTMKVLQVLTLTVLLAVALVMPRSIGPVGAAVIWVLCVVVVARSQAHGVLSFACLYLLLVGIFHLGLVAPISLGLTRVDHPPWLSSRYLSLALGLVTTAVVSFTLGVRMASRRDDLARVEAHTEPQPELFLVGLLVAVAGGGILWVGVVNLDVLSSGYGTYFERMVTGDVRFVWFGLMLFPIGLLVAAVGATRRQMMLLTALLIAALGPLFFKGFRGPVLVQAAALLAVWAHKDRRVARRVGLVVLAAALVLAPSTRRRSRQGSAASTQSPCSTRRAVRSTPWSSPPSASAVGPRTRGWGAPTRWPQGGSSSTSRRAAPKIGRSRQALGRRSTPTRGHSSTGTG